jgi:hypothetical protein
MIISLKCKMVGSKQRVRIVCDLRINNNYDSQYVRGRDRTSKGSDKSNAFKLCGEVGMKTHELKTDPEVFQETFMGNKLWEIRFDDRGYEIGDELWLRETKYSGDAMAFGMPLIYTGRYYHFIVKYILRSPAYGIQEGWVIMS